MSYKLNLLIYAPMFTRYSDTVFRNSTFTGTYVCTLPRNEFYKILYQVHTIAVIAVASSTTLPNNKTFKGYMFQHSARKATPYPWECDALPSKYFKIRSLSRRVCIDLLNKTWKMMSEAQRLADHCSSLFCAKGEKGRRIQVNKAMWYDSTGCLRWGLVPAGVGADLASPGASHRFVVT